MRTQKGPASVHMQIRLSITGLTSIIDFLLSPFLTFRDVITDIPSEQQVSPDSTSPSSQTQLLPDPEQNDDICMGYGKVANYRGSSPEGYRGRSPGGPDTTDNISNQHEEAEEEDNHEQMTAEVRLLYIS